MAITTNDKNLGHATAYAYAKSKGYTGTEEEFAELMASYATVAESAEESRQAAEVAQGKAEDAQAAAEAAQDVAVQAKDTAIGAKDTAASAATTATTKAGEASASATSASESATAAAGSATSAAGSASAASGSAATATTKAGEASNSATAAATAQTAAEDAQEAAEDAASSVSASTAQIATNTADISDLKNAFSGIIEVNQKWETADVTQTKISGYRIGTNGDAYEDASGSTICIPILSAGTYKVTSSSSSNLYMFIYNGLISNVSDITSTNKVGVFGTVGAERSDVVDANQTICVTARSTTLTCTVDIYKVETSLNASFGLTTTMQTQVSRIAETASSIANDALLYVDKIPAYYIDPTQTPTTFAEAKPYLEEKISQIPSRNAMLFITDVHWFGNQKHSTYLMNYIRKRTGIENVLFGGDVYGNALNKYYAVKVLGEYLYQSRQAFYDNYIPCVGDHDNNTVNVDNLAEDHVPYSQLSELFIGDVKYNYKCYAPVEKVASMATGDDYNEIMDFFKTVYYVDNDRIKTRIIVLNCGNGGNYGALYTVFGTTGIDLLRTQIPFLIDSLYSTPSGYNVCILSHKLEYGGAAPNAIMSLLSGFKTKISRIKPSPSTSGNANIESFWAYNTSYDFSDAPDLGFVFSLNGHTHTDRIKWAGFVNGSISRGNTYDGVTVLNQNESGQIPYITTATDASANTEPDSPTMTNGTVTEQCFDVISILSDGLALTRFGAGDNRRIYMELNSN